MDTLMQTTTLGAHHHALSHSSILDALRTSAYNTTEAATTNRSMTITTRVQAQLFETNERRPIRIAPSIVPPAQAHAQTAEDDFPAIASRGTPWSADEHERFLDALARFPSGPWKRIAAHVGSRTARQTMSHAQKYRQKIKRRQRYVARQASERSDHSIRAHVDAPELPFDSLYPLMVDNNSSSEYASVPVRVPWHEPHMATLSPMSMAQSLELMHDPLDWYALATAATAAVDGPVELTGPEWDDARSFV